ncbi:MAG: translation initiation factor [Bacteroidetes bacterium]|nr:translation initiation factor [Bacteroidota bacterium]
MAKQTLHDLSDLRSLFPGSGADENETTLSGQESHHAGKEKKNSAADRAIALSKLHVQLEKKGRKGKGVTVIKGFFHTKHDLETFARELKTRCGSGGTVKDDTIEIQGDHRSTAVAYFKAKGFKVTGGG